MSYFKPYLTFLFFLITIVSSSQNETNRGYKVKIGDELPSLTLHMMNGEIWTNKDFESKVVVIQFTGSWCSVCKKEMPDACLLLGDTNTSLLAYVCKRLKMRKLSKLKKKLIISRGRKEISNHFYFFNNLAKWFCSDLVYLVCQEIWN